jgi:hypothetical protein
MIKATCHCGAVSAEIPRKPRSLTECSCSVCRRYGARWAYFSKKTVKIRAARGALVAYKRGRVLYFDHCRHCGCVMQWRLVKSKGPDDRMAINMRMADNPGQLANLKILRFDGAKSWKDVGTCTLTEPWW